MQSDHGGYTDRELLIKAITTLETLQSRLLGNGQPGEIQRLDSKIKELQQDRDSQGRDIATARGAVLALKWIVSALGLSAITGWVLKWFGK